MKCGSLFTGIGGFDYAAFMMGWDIVFNCESDDFCRKIINYYWPKATTYDDIKTTDFTKYRGAIDIIFGGPPCQPASTAGQRKGESDDRWLWNEGIRALREIKPQFAIFENPTGILSLENGRSFQRVLNAMEAEGYEIEIFNIPACSIGAIHKRERIWIVAYTSVGGRLQNEQKRGKKFTHKTDVAIITHPHKFNEGLLRRKSGKITEKYPVIGNACKKWIYTNAFSKRFPFRATIKNRAQREQIYKNKQGQKDNSWSKTDGRSFTIRSAWPTQSPLCTRNDGNALRLDGITFPKWRRESIKGAGNMVVPQVVLQIFKAVEEVIKL